MLCRKWQLTWSTQLHLLHLLLLSVTDILRVIRKILTVHWQRHRLAWHCLLSTVSVSGQMEFKQWQHTRVELRQVQAKLSGQFNKKQPAEWLSTVEQLHVSGCGCYIERLSLSSTLPISVFQLSPFSCPPPNANRLSHSSLELAT